MGNKGQKRRRRVIRLVVIPKPDPTKRSILHYEGEGSVAMRAPDGPSITMVCGQCGVPLLEGVSVDQVENLVFRCNGCGAYNETLIS